MTLSLLAEIKTGSLTVILIGGIVTLLIVAFTLIVFLTIRFQTKRIHKQLETTKNEIEASALSKQLGFDYGGNGPIELDTIYEDCKEMYAAPIYEQYDQPGGEQRYMSQPYHQAQQTGSGAMNSVEPEYLTMTESSIYQQQPPPPQPPQRGSRHQFTSNINSGIYQNMSK